MSFFFHRIWIVQSASIADVALSQLLILRLIGPCLWRVILQRRRGKSPIAIESIGDRYCRSPEVLWTAADEHWRRLDDAIAAFSRLRACPIPDESQRASQARSGLTS